jgi:hypothetical protein
MAVNRAVVRPSWGSSDHKDNQQPKNYDDRADDSDDVVIS